jgi:iron complex outermembrane receptor protein
MGTGLYGGVRRALRCSGALAGVALFITRTALSQTPAVGPDGATPATSTAPAAAAQGPLAEVQITGTRVVRDGYQAPTPVTVLGKDTLDALAPNNIADALNQLPQMMSGVTPTSQPAGISGGALGVNELNLRDLGTNRTLILLDGKRVINSSISAGFSAPDVNTVPSALISRVDVVTGGASAAYGSDALAGVVNFVLDHDFTGIKGEAEGGISTYADDGNYSASIALGTPFGPDSRGHFLLAGEVAHNAGISGNPRPWNADNASVITNPAWTQTNGLPYYLVARQIGLSNGTPGGLITEGPLKGVTFGPGGVPTMFNYGLVSTNNVMSGGDWQESRIDNGLDLDAHVLRENVFSRLSFDVTDKIQVYGEIQWAYTDAGDTATPNRRLDNLTLQASNPFVPAAIAAQLAALGQTSFVMGTTNGDIGRVEVENGRTLARWDVGASGRFALLGSDWNWDAYYQRSGEGIDSHALNNAITANYLLAVDAVRDPATGAIVCRSSLTTPGNGCVPYNPIGTGVNTQAAIDYVTGSGFRHDSLYQDVGAANVHGAPLSSWAGPVSLALGVEHRRETVSGDSTALDAENAFFTGDYHASHGAYDVSEGFVETVVPLAKDLPGAQALDLNAAARATDYSTSGYVTTWKIGASYTPVSDLRFRATRSRDIRAPSLGELFSAGQATTGAPLYDPFTRTNVSNSISLSKGNSLLQPEEADTTEFGVVFSPRFLPGFEASVDYYNIDINSAIQVPNSQTVVNLCYQGNSALCSDIQRTAGIITLVVTSPENILSEKTRGLDIEASYRMALAALHNGWKGDLSLRVLGTYVMSLETSGSTGVVEGSGVLGGTYGAFGSAVSTGLSSPKFVSQAFLTYDLDPLSALVTARYVGDGVYNNAFASCAAGCPAGSQYSINDNHIPSNIVFGLYLNYKLFADRDATVFLGIDNVLNRYPPIIGGNTMNTYYLGQANSDYYDRIGRMFRAGVRFKL